MTFIHFVTGKSSGILSDIFSGIRSGILSGISSGILPGISSGRCSGISSGRCSGISSGISSGICYGISSGIPSGILSGISSGILSGKSSGIPSDILSSISSGILSGKSAGILSGKHSGTLSGISSGILSDILSGILSGIPSGILSGISSNILSGISSGTLCGISFGVDTRGWGPAGNTGRGWSWLRSGREHWAGILAVEVRQGTLGVDGRGWGPAGNTGRGWSRLRSGREHWAWMVVVEVRQRTLCVEGRGWAGGGGEERRRGEEQATDIKSNNPHLAGGEKVKTHDAQSSQVCCYDYGIFGCNSFEEHLSTVFAELKQFCARNSLQLHMMHLSRQLLGFTKSSEYPIGILGCSRIQTFFLTCYKCVFDFMVFMCDSADCPGIGSKVLTQFRSWNFLRWFFLRNYWMPVWTKRPTIFSRRVWKPQEKPIGSWQLCTMPLSGLHVQKDELL